MWALADRHEPERSTGSQPKAARRANGVRQCLSYFLSFAFAGLLFSGMLPAVSMDAERPSSKTFPWKWADFVLPLLLFMPAADFAAICGDQAAALHMRGADVVRHSQFLMFAAAVFVPLILVGTRLARWRHRITAALVILCMMSAPILLWVATSAIPLSRELTQEEYADFREAFEIPSARYSATGEGHRLRVRREDDTAGLRWYLKRMGVLGAAGR